MSCAGGITLSEPGARRLRRALEFAERELRRIEFTRAHPRAAEARAARIEIGAGVAHLDAALPPATAPADEVAP